MFSIALMQNGEGTSNVWYIGSPNGYRHDGWGMKAGNGAGGVLLVMDEQGDLRNQLQITCLG